MDEIEGGGGGVGLTHVVTAVMTKTLGNVWTGDPMQGFLLYINFLVCRKGPENRVRDELKRYFCSYM